MRPCRRSRALPFALLLAAGSLAPGAARAEALVVATSQVCTGNAAGDCVSGSPVVGRGATADMSQSWGGSNGFYLLASTNVAVDYGAFSIFARASGYDIPESGTEFLYTVNRTGRSFGNFSDDLSAGAGGAPGYFRIPLHVTGAATVSWQNGFGVATLAFSCYSTPPGGATYLGQCPLTQLDFLADETLDTVVNLDIPIVLGSPFHYQVSFSLGATTGHGYGPVPFTGATEASFSAGPFPGASVLDAGKDVIPNAPISASESGFVYAPEPGSLASLLAALLALAAVAAARPARAEDALPPERPTTAYRAEVRNTYQVSRPGGGESGGDTLEIRVSGARLYEDSKIMEEKAVIVDTEKREVLEFEAGAEPKVAARFALNDAPIPYVGGRAAIASIDPAWGEPRVAGKDEVAKHACTLLHFGKPEEDGAVACVSKQGVVLRARLVWEGYQREFELLDFDPGKQDEKWFRPPKGFQIVDG